MDETNASRKTKKRSSKKTNYDKKKLTRDQIQLAIVKKKETDAKALRIVEQLLEPHIDKEWLLENLQHINKCHLEDVIEERSIIKICGYALCSNPLLHIKNQRYTISVKEKKVYDITKRKKFCSASCYGAANYLLEQMLSSPLWLRDKEEIPEFKIFEIDHLNDSKDSKSHGDKVDLEIYSSISAKDIEPNEKAEKEMNADEIECSALKMQLKKAFCNKVSSCTDSDKKNNTAAEKCNNTINLSENSFKNNSDEEIVQYNYLSTQKSSSDVKLLEPEKKSILDFNSVKCNQRNTKVLDEQMPVINKSELKTIYVEETIREGCKIKSNSKECKIINCSTNLAFKIEKILFEWVTESTLTLLFGDEEAKTKIINKIRTKDKYNLLCEKLNRLQYEDEKEDQDILDTTDKTKLKPTPHYDILKEEGKKLELKVRAFYGGKTIIDTTEEQSVESNDALSFDAVFPITESIAPNTLRKRIFLDKLNKTLPELLKTLIGSNQELERSIFGNLEEKSALIQTLINTFKLTATNVMFKMAEWNLVGLLIIKMLSLIDPHLKNLLTSKQAVMYASMILMSYKLEANYLDILMLSLLHKDEKVIPNLKRK